MSLRRTLAIARLIARRRVLLRTRSWLARSFGVTQEGRIAIIARMLEGHARSAPAYWLQLSVALALATLGLVLNGPAVIIGAMLVSPLMSPIIELGMGLAVGSALLSIRSLVRVFASIAVVVLGATLITAALPFHEVTGEVAIRTSPTALDLLVAIFCALAAAFTTLRSGSDAASAAAGTAIAIALVPPLCVVGFGLGTADRAIAQGAFLLFTANLCAILLVAAFSFWLFGFNLINTRQLEQKRLEEDQPLGRSVRLVKLAFGSRFGTWVRLIIPLALVATVWLPLTRALGEVSWEVHTRAEVQKILDSVPLAQSAVRSSLSLKHRTIHIGMVVVGKPSQARALQAELATRIATATTVAPTVEVVAVPDLETMEDVARTLAKSELAQRELVQRRPHADLHGSTTEVGTALAAAWPSGAVGPLRRWRMELTAPEQPLVEVVHLGEPLGDAGQSLLAKLLSDHLNTSLTVREVVIPAGVATAGADDGAGWLPRLTAAIDWVRGERGLVACVTLPPPDKPRRNAKHAERAREDARAAVRAAVLAELAKAGPQQVHLSAAEEWSVQLRDGACDTPAPASAPTPSRATR